MTKRDVFGQEHLKPLTSLRFVAALLVFIYHCDPTASIGTAYALGHAGVGFFFLLSGFILTYTYYDDFTGGTSWNKVRAFYVARIARIYPLHLVGMGLATTVLWHFGGTFWDRSDTATRELAFVAQASLAQSWFPNENVYFGINAPAWSISVEAFFYALFPFLIASLSRSFVGRSRRTIFVAAALPWLILVAAVLIPHQIVVWTAYVIPPVRVVDFTVGMMVGIAFLRQRQIAEKISTGTMLELVAVAAVAAAILVSPKVPEGLRYTLFLMPFWAFLIWVLVWQQGEVSNFLSQPLFVRMGEASFAFYLVHWSVIQAVTHTVGWDDPISSIALTLAAVLCLSLALYRTVEQPLRNHIRNALLKPRQLKAMPEPEASLAAVDEILA